MFIIQKKSNLKENTIVKSHLLDSYKSNMKIPDIYSNISVQTNSQVILHVHVATIQMQDLITPKCLQK